jgi:nucleoside-diphosphate-sugar epimerase
MRAYWEAILHCQAGEVYNIGGTTTVTVGEVLERLVSMSRVSIRVRCDPSLLRPADVTLQIPSVEKFARETGWQPVFTFEKSLTELLAYWRLEAKHFAQRKAMAEDERQIKEGERNAR